MIISLIVFLVFIVLCALSGIGKTRQIKSAVGSSFSVDDYCKIRCLFADEDTIVVGFGYYDDVEKCAVIELATSATQGFVEKRFYSLQEARNFSQICAKLLPIKMFL